MDTPLSTRKNIAVSPMGKFPWVYYGNAVGPFDQLNDLQWTFRLQAQAPKNHLFNLNY